MALIANINQDEKTSLDKHSSLFPEHQRHKTKTLYNINTCVLYYKHITIINDDSSIVNKWLESLTNDSGVILYDHNVFIIQATLTTVS